MSGVRANVVHDRLCRFRAEIATEADVERVVVDLRRVWGVAYVDRLLADLERTGRLTRPGDGTATVIGGTTTLGKRGRGPKR